MLTIRLAQEDDLEGIRAIRNYYIAHTFSLWQTEPLTMPDMWLWWEEHKPPVHPIFVAEEERGGVRKITGYASLSPFRWNPGYRFTKENSIYLHPDYAKQGIGSRLMEAIVEAGRAAGLKQITAWIDGGNERSVAFHARHGFALAGRMNGVGEKWEKRRDVVIMVKDLMKD